LLFLELAEDSFTLIPGSEGSYQINKKFAFSNSKKRKKSHEGLRRKTNDRTRPLNLGPRILKIVVFGARRRLLRPHFERLSSKEKRFFLLKKRKNTDNESTSLIYYAKIYYKQYISLSTLLPVGVGVKVPATILSGNLINYRCKYIALEPINIHSSSLVKQ
jgi:hypothetical protein